MIMFCLPHAGGSSMLYLNYRKCFGDVCDVQLLDYPGHGIKSNLNLKKNILDIANDLYEEIKEKVNEKQENFVIYGHSMGGIVAYEVTNKVLQDNTLMDKLQCLFISGTSLDNKEESIGDKTSDEFWDIVYSFGFVSTKDVMLNDDIKEYFEPILRADFNALQEYEVNYKNTINIEMCVMFGSKDRRNDYTKMKNWEKLCKKPVEFVEFNGNHFFNLESNEEFISFMRGKMKNYIKMEDK